MRAASVPRAISASVVEALTDTPVVVVNGARQVGKSTLAAALPYAGSVEVVTLDDQATRDAAVFDPRAFVQRPVDTLVIDEAQLVPPLFRAIKADVDRDRRPGRFLLTGSSRLLSAPDMADSLVGRVEVLELWPFAQSEIDRTAVSASDPTARSASASAPAAAPPFVDSVFDAPQSLLRSSSAVTSGRLRDDVIARLCAGGFPEAVRRTPGRRGPWFDGYVTTSVERMVGRVSDIERSSEIPRLLRLCAARTGQELNVSNLANDFGIPVRIANGYLATLASAFMVRLLPAWSTNLSAKVVRRPKLLMVDSGLAVHLLGQSPATLAAPNSPLGPLLESFVATELLKQIGWSTHRPTLQHLRDRDGAEVDLVLEHPDGRVIGIEVKATSTPRADDFRGLRWLAGKLGPRFAFGVVLSTAPEATPFGPAMAALPVDVLWR